MSADVSSMIACLVPRRAQAVRAAHRERLVIVGNGMVGQRLCERLIQLAATDRYELVVLSEEATPAYDRVHLTDLIRGRSARELLLRDPDWYAQNDIELRLEQRVESFDRAARTVRTEAGDIVAYDKLVLATGSRARAPKLALEHGTNLILYRTLQDAQRILVELESSRARDLPIVVLGAGLLGLEAARTFQLLGRSVIVLEAASQLLPRQLDPAAAAELQSLLQSAGLDVRMRCSVESVARAGDATRMKLARGEDLDAAVIVAAVGAHAEDELGRRAGLRCHVRGGIEVDSALCTSDPNVFAIGECASHAAVPHGLVAPGYAMADRLAENLVGKRRRLAPQAAITRLKLDLTEVTVIGDPIGTAYDEEIVWRAPGSYRRVLLGKRRIVAAISIGAWSELPAVQGLALAGRRLVRSSLTRFKESGTLGLASASDVSSFADAAVICQCANVSLRVLRRAIASGHCNADALSRATGAGTLCGTCRPTLVTLTGGSMIPEPRFRERAFVIAAAVALALSTVTLLAPKIPISTSVLTKSIDVLWTNSLYKQLTGYALVALVTFGLAFSLRKRVARFRLSSYARLRAWHGVFGVLAIAGLFAHTGWRIGSNLNLCVMLLFLTSAVTGAFAALCGAFEGTPARGAQLARGFRRAHEITFWPLPVLVLFHALKGYYF